MGKIVLLPETKTVMIKGEKKQLELLSNEKYDLFNPSLLGLGDISLPSTQIEAIAAIYDLSGFTTFCSQVDPHLSVPEYLSKFLNWLFDRIKGEFVAENYNEGKGLWANLPFLAKFSGDGVLFLWNTYKMSGVEICNIVTTLSIIRDEYNEKFYQEIKKVVVNPPNDLRCGIARGRVFSVGNGDDYVGPCINIASRLQKLSLLSFCVSRRGFDFEKDMDKQTASEFLLKSVDLRGIGKNELIWVLKEKFAALPDKEKELFKNP